MTTADRQVTTAVSVDLAIPVQADLVVLARLTAATVAGRAGFGVEDIEDLRLAVEELCLSLVGSGKDGRLQLSYESDGEALTVRCTYDGDHGAAAGQGAEADDLSLRILDALVDEHGRDSREGRASAWLRKGRGDQPA